MTLIAWPNPTRPSRISVGKGLAQEPERSERFLAAKPYGEPACPEFIEGSNHFHVLPFDYAQGAQF